MGVTGVTKGEEPKIERGRGRAAATTNEIIRNREKNKMNNATAGPRRNSNRCKKKKYILYIYIYIYIYKEKGGINKEKGK